MTMLSHDPAKLNHDPATTELLPQLSLCIPTYNRALLLREALEAVASQGDAALFAVIEIVISDNASPDGTFEMVQSIAHQYPYLKLHYFRQPENVGVNQNIYDVVERATGEFVWILSDDDMLLPGALPKLFSLRQAYPEINAFCLNMRTFQNDPYQEENRPALPVEHDILLPDRDSALMLFGTWMTFISVVAFRKSALTRSDYAQRITTWLGYSYQFLDTLSRGSVVVSQPYLAVRDNYRGGYNFFEVFVTRFQELLSYAREIGYSPMVTRRVLRQHLRSFLFLFLLSFKRRQTQENPMNYSDGARRLLRAYPGDPFLLLVMLPLLSLPSNAVRAIYALFQLFKGRKRQGLS